MAKIWEKIIHLSFPHPLEMLTNCQPMVLLRCKDSYMSWPECFNQIGRLTVRFSFVAYGDVASIIWIQFYQPLWSPWTGNILHYHQSTPPVYDLSKVTAPTAIFKGDADDLVSLIDVDILGDHLLLLKREKKFFFFSLNLLFSLSFNLSTNQQILRTNL